MPTPSGPAKLYVTQRPDTPFQVVYRDPTRFEKSGRAKRVVQWFADREAAERYRDQTNETLLIEGSAGIAFDADLRHDAIAARTLLDAKGHGTVTLRALAERYCAQLASSDTAARPIAPEVAEFLADHENDGAAIETIKNLKTRLWLWIDLACIAVLGDITRESVECLRKRAVAPQTRRNDLNAVSIFCTWLVSAIPPRLEHHPLKGIRRPRVQHGHKPTWTADECERALRAAADVQRTATLAVMLYAGARPSELQETRLIYGRHPLVRIEGGKLKGRANRVVPMLPALRSFLAAAGNPDAVPTLTRHERERIATAAGLQWKADITRHTFISNRLQLARNDALVAREGGTSETVIFRHYHALKSPAEARRWEKLRSPQLTRKKTLDEVTV